MLVLQRKEHERTLIGGGISVVVCRIEGSRVTLGIDAPDFITLQRDENVPELSGEIAEQLTTAVDVVTFRRWLEKQFGQLDRMTIRDKGSADFGRLEAYRAVLSKLEELTQKTELPNGVQQEA